jgi:hypothetical protein
MTYGTVARPTGSDYLAAMRRRGGGGGQSGGLEQAQLRVFRGRRRVGAGRKRKGGRKVKRRRRRRQLGAGCSGGRRRGVRRRRRRLVGAGRRRRKKLKGGWAVLARILPWLRKIPNFFRSPVGRKVATTLARAGLQVAADRSDNPKGSWKESLKRRGKEAAIDLLGTAKAGLEGSGRGRRRRRRQRKSIKGITGGGRRIVRRKSTRRLRRSTRKTDIFD